MNPPVTIRTLTDGGQTAVDVANQIAAFLDSAERTLELAQYDFELGAESAAIVGAAIRRAHERGVHIRLVYNVDHRKPIPVPPPPSPDETLIRSLPIEAMAIAGVPDLMHHKYVVRDGDTVWTGSTNWTDDSWSRQENVVVIVESAGIAADFQLDFEQLVGTESVAASGLVEPRWREGVRAWFTPHHGEDLSHRIAQAIAHARRRVRVCSPVITTAPVLAVLARTVAAGQIDVAGCVDETQVRGVAYQWGLEGKSWKLPLLARIAKGAFSAKPSTPYGTGTLHDFMHAKVTVVDDLIFVGSFNLSRSGERNAENVLEFEDPKLAGELTAFVDGIRGRYPRLELGS
jgi:phosphatidylserine/phosphatidylglycerophosphate/cardiolipin synthase-like enzyme